MDILGKIRLTILPIHKKAEYYRKLGVKIGKGSEIYSRVNFGSEPYLVTLGDNVRVTAGVQFITHDGGIWVLRKMGLLENTDLFGQIKVGDNVHIGINSIIMPNVAIGSNCIIGCGAVVTKDIPDNSIAVGVPARVIKTIEEYFEKNKKRVDFTKNLNSKAKKAYLSEKYS